MEWVTDVNAWVALITLTALEIVLGIDNIIFISILSSKVQSQKKSLARRAGLLVAMGSRILLLLCLSLIMRLTAPLFTIYTLEISGRDIILFLGGLFLLMKSTLEIHEKLEGSKKGAAREMKHTTFIKVLIQIALLDVVFSLDSVITAIGLADHVSIMIIAIIIAVCFMMIFVNAVSDFVETHPTIKVLALSFLLMIGLALIGDSLDMHIPKGYIYFAMAFSVFVEMINLRVRTEEKSV